jgi:hypothetical protein
LPDNADPTHDPNEAARLAASFFLRNWGIENFNNFNHRVIQSRPAKRGWDSDDGRTITRLSGRE